MIRISFVIPAYNVERYLRQCLDSLLERNVEDYQVILIDDGSTDSTPDIISAYQARHANVKSLRQNNSGQGAARNAGLDMAIGEYIWFIDADDWIEECALSYVLATLDVQTPDVLFCNYVKAFSNGSVRLNSLPSNLAGRQFNPDSLPEMDFAAVSCWNSPPWRIISRRSLLLNRNIRFPVGLLYEDHPFTLQVMRHAKSVFMHEPPSYVYRQRSDSSAHRQDRKVLDFIAIRKICLSLFNEYDWRDRYPNLYASYLLPADFMFAHVAPHLRTEFLFKLREELSDDDRQSVLLSNRAQALGFLKAVDQGRIWPYRFSMFADRAKHAFGRVLTLKSIWSLLKAAASLWRRRKKRRTRRRRGPDPRLFIAHESADIANLRLDVRRCQEDRIYAHIGEDADLACLCVFETGLGKINFGRRCSVGHNTMIICSQERGIHVGDSAMVSWGCTITDNDSHSIDPDLRHNDAWHWKLGKDRGQLGLYKDWSAVRRAPVTIGDDAWVGFDSVILAGVTVGRGAVVGARSVLTRSVPPWTVFAGNPARFIRLVPRRGGWVWTELVAALKAEPECTCELAEPERIFEAALGRSLGELVIRSLPESEIYPRSEYWPRLALKAGAAHAEWLDGLNPALRLIGRVSSPVKEKE